MPLFGFNKLFAYIYSPQRLNPAMGFFTSGPTGFRRGFLFIKFIIIDLQTVTIININYLIQVKKTIYICGVFNFIDYEN